MENYENIIRAYAEEAEAVGWYGPEVIFGLIYKYIEPGQLFIDLGVGTGLGSALFQKAGMKVHGVDNSPEMIDACRNKGFLSLKIHDLTDLPYPYKEDDFDHALCTGVMNFISDLSPIFKGVKRIVRPGGLFAFVTGDCKEKDQHEIIVGPEQIHTDKPVAMYRHSPERIRGWLKKYGFEEKRNLGFTVYMDRKRTRKMPARAYVVKNR